jgi:hypothetical protein
MMSNEKSLNYRVLDFVEHYKFVVGHISIRSSLKIQDLEFQNQRELKPFFGPYTNSNKKCQLQSYRLL